jgi:hypothetical protein
MNSKCNQMTVVSLISSKEVQNLFKIFVVTAGHLEPGQLSLHSDGLRAGQPGFDCRQGQEIFLYSTASRLALGPTQPFLWVLAAVSPGVKRPGSEADLSLSSSVGVKNGGAMSPHPHMSS